MNIENFEQWMDWLRANDLPQADGTLMQREVDEEGDPIIDPKTGEDKVVGFCCMGVACIKADPDNEWQWMGQDLPPVAFHQWLGLAMQPGDANDDVRLDAPDDLLMRPAAEAQPIKSPLPSKIGEPMSMLTASKMNDTLGLTFPQIADMFTYFGIRPWRDE